MGFYPPNATVALVMALISMICWGSWANVMKKVDNWRFEALYWDYAWSIVFFSFIFTILLGGVSVFNTLTLSTTGLALFSGLVWGFGNILLVVSIVLAGYAVAFPIAIGFAVILGTLLAFFTKPSATLHPEFLFIGIAFIILAIFLNAFAYRLREIKKEINQKISLRGIFIALASGLLIGLFPFPFNFAFEAGLNGYTGALLMSAGGLIATFLLLPFLMKRPLVPDQKPITFREYSRGKLTWHLWGVVGGLVWSIGTTLNLLVASQPQFGIATTYALGNGAPMVATLWGIFVWNEFKKAPQVSYLVLVFMFLFFILGITSLSLSIIR